MVVVFRLSWMGFFEVKMFFRGYKREIMSIFSDLGGRGG